MVAVSWIVRITPPSEAGADQPLDSAFGPLASLLWDLGTTGIAEIGGGVLAGFDQRSEADHAVDIIGALGEGDFDAYNVTVEPVVEQQTHDSVGSAVLRWSGDRIEFGLKTDGAFGHGRHSTTMTALDLLPTALASPAGQAPTSPGSPEPRMSMLDVGTGTGVLAIAAALTGRASVSAVDIDPKALTIAADNATANDVDIDVMGDSVHALADLRRRFNLVVANVLLSDHRELAPPILDLVCGPTALGAGQHHQGGLILLSGYLIEQVDELLELYSDSTANVEILACSYRGAWTGHLLALDA